MINQKSEWVKPELEQLEVEETLNKPFFATEDALQSNGSPIGPGGS